MKNQQKNEQPENMAQTPMGQGFSREDQQTPDRDFQNIGTNREGFRNQAGFNEPDRPDADNERRNTNDDFRNEDNRGNNPPGVVYDVNRRRPETPDLNSDNPNDDEAFRNMDDNRNDRSDNSNGDRPDEDEDLDIEEADINPDEPDRIDDSRPSDGPVSPMNRGIDDSPDDAGLEDEDERVGN